MSTHREPSIGIVIATRNRPELVQRALEAVLGQAYDGVIEVALVFDQCDPDRSLISADPWRPVTVGVNRRTPGLAGARNTGILRLSTEMVGFCDDDDVWLSGKLTAQLERLRHRPAAGFVTTSMVVDYGGRCSIRLAGQDSVSLRDLTRSRMAMLHSSSFLFRRDAMLGSDGFGLVDETVPGSMAEDWDLLLRAARQHPIEHVDEPLVRVLWGASSYFNHAWMDKNAAHAWLLEHHPEIRQDRRGFGLMLAKLAFGHAALEERGAAWRNVRTAIGVNWREPRTPLALLVLAGVPPRWIVEHLNKRGHGI